MTSRSDHQRNNRFRAPQFALGRPADGDAPFGELALDSAFGPATEPPASAESSSDAPTIIVRRRRQVQRPAEASAEASQGDAESRRPRVFLLPRTEDADGGAVQAPRADDAAADPSSPDDPVSPARGDPPAPTVPPRRRATPDFKRAGPVTIARPLDEAARNGADVDAATPSLAELMTKFDALTEQLAALTARPQARLDLDLTINKRWDSIYSALQALRDSLATADLQMAF
jgi:hypothetical protein